MQGPDEVHIQQIGKLELKRVPALLERDTKVQRERQRLGQEWGGKAKL